MKIRHGFAISVICLLLSLALTSCVQPVPTGAPGVTQPAQEMIVVGLAEAPTTLDPADHRSRLQSSPHRARWVFDRPIKYSSHSGR